MLLPTGLLGIPEVCKDNGRDDFLLGRRGGQPFGTPLICFRGCAVAVERTPSCCPDDKIIVIFGFKLVSESS